MLEFRARLLLSHGRGHGSESIDHNGAVESGSVASPRKKTSGKEPRLAAQEEGEGGGEGRCAKKMEGGKQFFGLLRSCYSTPN